jgi:subtilase family serine protease
MLQSRLLTRSVLIALSAAVVAVPSTVVSAAPSQAAGPAPTVALATSMAPPLPAGAVRLGALPPRMKLGVEVTLTIPDQAALTAFLAGLTDPRSPSYQHFLRPGQFGPRFGPSLAQVAAVDGALRSAGLSPGRVSADRLAIPVTATAAAIEHAFGIALERYRLPGGRDGYATTAAPRVPATVAPLVQGVLGLDDLYPEQHLSGEPGQRAIGRLAATPVAPEASRTGARAAPAASALGPQPCSAATDSLANTANTVAAHYGLSLLYLVGDLGTGIRIGVAELEPNLPSDITAYEKCYGISTKVNYIKVDGGVKAGAGSGEAALDIEMLAGLAPESVIDVYQAPNSTDGFYDIFKQFVTSDTDRVLSVSWASCEADTAVASMTAQESLFEQANAQGQTVFAAAGDDGSTSCYHPPGSTSDRVSPESPAIEPYVIGVGGTSFSGSGTSQQEIVWNDSSLDLGAGGGGVSSVWCMPGYQHQAPIPGIVSADSHKDTSSSCASKYYRESPDITADGDPLYGYAVYYDGSWASGGFGGTSAATPVWASIAALTDVSPFCAAYASKGPTLPQNLYNAVAAYHSYVYSPSSPQVVKDITSGNNDYTPSGYTGGLYPSTKGYDMASGLGAPMVSGLSDHEWYVFLAGLTQLLCHQSATKLTTLKVTSVTPSSGPAGKPAKVTVHGTGFLPIAFADKAEVLSGTKVLATSYATCTTTACTVSLPAEPAQTVNIKIYAESLWSSSLTAADRYTYTS